MPPKNRLLERALKVESVSPEYVKKFRTRGVRGGKKGFSMPAGKSASTKKLKKKRNLYFSLLWMGTETVLTGNL